MVLDEAFKLSARDEVLQRPDIRKPGIHPNFWYPVARSDNVKTGKPHGVSFAGEPIVLVRTECCSCPDFVDNKNGLFARCIFGNLFIELGTPERLASEERLASLSQFKGPYKRSKFLSYLEVKKRADTGWPIVTTLPTAPIGPHDLRPTPTGMIIVAFLKGRIPLLARTGLNFVDVRDCALGHLLTMARAKSGERYLLGGINLWLCDFLKRVEPHARYRTPRFYAPHWLRFLTACASETAGRLWPNWTPFVTREAVQMSRGPHFSSNAKAENELGYVPTSSIDPAIHDAVEDFVARGLVPFAAGGFSSARERRRSFRTADRHGADRKIAAASNRHS
jgi:hypothetical protein